MERTRIVGNTTPPPSTVYGEVTRYKRVYTLVYPGSCSLVTDLAVLRDVITGNVQTKIKHY
jgi:hypothetical protein